MENVFCALCLIDIAPWYMGALCEGGGEIFACLLSVCKPHSPMFATTMYCGMSLFQIFL